MKKILLIIATLFLSHVLFAQWNNLGSGLNSFVQSATVFQSKLYVYGSFTSSGSTAISNQIAQWNGTTWENVPVPITNATISYVESTANYLVVGISRSSPSSLPVFNGTNYNYSVVKYDGTGWTGVSNPELKFFASGSNEALANYVSATFNQKLLYLTRDVGYKHPRITQFDGVNMTLLLDSSCSSVNTGYGKISNFSQINTDMYYLNNSTFRQYFSNNSTCNTVDNLSSLSLIKSYKDEIYAIGKVYGTTTSSYIAKWNPNDYAWYTVGNPQDSIGCTRNCTGSNNNVSSLTIYNDELYLTGVFKRANQQVVNSIIRWTGTAWNSVEGGVYNVDGSAGYISFAIEYNGELIVGGLFGRAGTKTANNIAKFKTIPTGIEQDNNLANSLRLYPNPTKEVLNISNQGVETVVLQIYNSQGQQVFTQAVNIGEQQINIGHLSKGIYFCQLKDQSNRSVQNKLIVE